MRGHNKSNKSKVSTSLQVETWYLYTLRQSYQFVLIDVRESSKGFIFDFSILIKLDKFCFNSGRVFISHGFCIYNTLGIFSFLAEDSSFSIRPFMCIISTSPVSSWNFSRRILLRISKLLIQIKLPNMLHQPMYVLLYV